MNDQENIREMRLRLKAEEEKLAEEKLEKELKLRKDHIDRLTVLHRRARGEKW
jgi:predicted RecB family nuclease